MPPLRAAPLAIIAPYINMEIQGVIFYSLNFHLFIFIVTLLPDVLDVRSQIGATMVDFHRCIVAKPDSGAVGTTDPRTDLGTG